MVDLDVVMERILGRLFKFFEKWRFAFFVLLILRWQIGIADKHETQLFEEF